MNEHEERTQVLPDQADVVTPVPEPPEAPEPVLVEQPVQAEPLVQEPEVVASPTEAVNGHGEPDLQDWHAEAGRKGAHRVHQLIERGRLYEQEHGLKSGRQRLRQLVELGKLYEQEHGLQPAAERKTRSRLTRMERAEVLRTLVNCLLRIAKPSFRKELTQLLEALQDDQVPTT
jgi:hypothetical protein